MQRGLTAKGNSKKIPYSAVKESKVVIQDSNPDNPYGGGKREMNAKESERAKGMIEERYS